MEPEQQLINKADVIASARLMLIKHNVANFGARKNREEVLKRREQIRLFTQFLKGHPQDRFVAHPTQKKTSVSQGKKSFFETLVQLVKKLKMRVKKQD